METSEALHPESASHANPSAGGDRGNRSEIISLLRGICAGPVLGSLAEIGVVDRMLEGLFGPEDLPVVKNRVVLASIFRYLQALGLLIPAEGKSKYELTAQGRTTFKRSGAFLLLLSYHEYFEGLSQLLIGAAAAPTVDRHINVLGSGSLHGQKFFPIAMRMLEKITPSALIDIGCGDGTFLKYAGRIWPNLRKVGIDLSPIAIDTSIRELDAPGSPELFGVVANAKNVDDWASQLPTELKGAEPLVISMWFVAHEFSLADSLTIVEFFQQLHSHFPAARIILGEITSIPPNTLAENREISIMPEFLLFHELSYQGVLGWEQWMTVLGNIPYRLADEHLVDVLVEKEGNRIPSSFVWYLTPFRVGHNETNEQMQSDLIAGEKIAFHSLADSN